VSPERLFHFLPRIFDRGEDLRSTTVGLIDCNINAVG
jgi:hypothetical protein